MAQDNQVVIVGNLTRDPELRYTPNGAALVKFGVAVSRRVKDDATGQWKDADTSFFDVTAWRSLAENVAETLTQGNRVVVVGRLRTNSWETPEGEKNSMNESTVMLSQLVALPSTTSTRTDFAPVGRVSAK